MKSGLILINAYANLAPVINQAERLSAEFEKLGVKTEIKTRAQVLARIDDNGNAFADIENYDFCVYLDKDKYLSQILEKRGLRLFNSHSAIQACDDKMQTHLLLSGNGIPMPATIPAPLCYTPAAPVDKQMLDYVEKTLGYPVIAKACYGSRGEFVFKADDRKSLEALAEKLKLTPHLYQRFVKESCGKDVRVIVIGGKVKAAMIRRAESDFRSNIELGGTGFAYNCPPNMLDLCERTAKILKLDYCGIDVLQGDKNYVCEVNSNAFFGGIESVTGINVARLYAEHILSVV